MSLERFQNISNNGTGKVYSCPNSELLKMEAASKQ